MFPGRSRIYALLMVQRRRYGGTMLTSGAVVCPHIIDLFP